MTPRRLATRSAAGVAALAVAAFLAMNARPIEPTVHRRMITDLSALQQLDAHLDEDVVKLRDGLLATYDPLVATWRLIDAHRQDLAAAAQALESVGSSLRPAIDDLSRRLDAKKALIEQFKSRNALLRNSFHYLPLSARTLLSDSALPAAVRSGTQSLVRDILLLRVGASSSDYELVVLQADQLRALGTQLDPLGRARLDVLLRHAHNIVEHQAQLDRLVRELTGTSVEEAGRSLAGTYNRAFESALREANLYRFMLLALSLALMAYAVHSFLRLRNSRAQLQQAFDRQQAEISARERAQAALGDSEERYRKLFDLSPDGMLIHCEGRIVLVNSMCMKMFGAARAEELLGKPILELIHPDYRERARERIRRTATVGGPSVPEERKMVALNGAVLDVELAGSPFVHRGKPSFQVVLRDIGERKRSEERLNYLAQYDVLTGLPNRSLFRDRLEHSLAQAARSGRPAAVLFIDLDHFKTVNDTLGHAMGDKLLKEAAARLKDCVRTGDTVGRFGGDEFGVILSDLAQPSDAGRVAQKINERLGRAFELDGQTAFVSASIGITLYPADATDAETLNMNADVAMYRAKEKGRNAYQFFTPEMNERAVHRMQMEAAMRGALEHHEFVLHYQPKVDVVSGAICGVEALLRWAHPQRGLVSPAEFVPVLEETGLIIPVGEWVIAEACRQMAAWRRAGLDVPPVAVNLSARQFQQKNLEQTVHHILRETGIAPQLLQFEITESLLMKDPAAAERILHGMKSAGVELSVDDFGTGYSSLAYLRRFPLDALKIDRAFIKDVVANPDDAAITLAVINLAHSLNLKVIAEGVETEGQFNVLALHACDQIQGYYFSRPVPAAEIETMVRAHRRLARSEHFTAGKPALLVVDDSEDDLALLARLLRGEDFPVLTAGSAEQAYGVLASHPVAVIVSDQRMPGISGAEFLAKVAKLYPRVVRVAISAVQDHEIIARAVNQASVHKFLSKSWGHERLRAELRESYQAATAGARAA